ncbi:hypothetical protein BLNAU_24005 [Blattamonas nauphoetae]|uniref:Uncharacterized protein n=1 Tax=Blattamonas nauphoetae TaxID=2049346 RepID=A0ABQ9WNN7_9EUKA|nr:hypothetical protein BLNAU_24005 [Blattamonas nauphoetae]
MGRSMNCRTTFDESKSTVCALNIWIIDTMAGQFEDFAFGFTSNKICKLTDLNVTSNRINNKGGIIHSLAIDTNVKSRQVNVASNDMEYNTITSKISLIRTNTYSKLSLFQWNDCSNLILSSLKDLFEKNTLPKKDGIEENVKLNLESLQQDLDQLDKVRSLLANETATLMK